jgi:hypothetical protein
VRLVSAGAVEHADFDARHGVRDVAARAAAAAGARVGRVVGDEASLDAIGRVADAAPAHAGVFLELVKRAEAGFLKKIIIIIIIIIRNK